MLFRENASRAKNRARKIPLDFNKNYNRREYFFERRVYFGTTKNSFTDFQSARPVLYRPARR